MELFAFTKKKETLYVEIKPRSVALSWRRDYEVECEDAYELSYDFGDIGTEKVKRAVSVQLAQTPEKQLLKKLLEFGLFKDLEDYIKRFM